MTHAQDDFFNRSLRKGEDGERVLDAYFAPHYDILPATPSQQRDGIDRWFTPHARPEVAFAVEYKTDYHAPHTGSAFVETVSARYRDGRAEKRGWAHTSRARFLVYHVPTPRCIYVVRFTVLRAHLPRWVEVYPHKLAPNADYVTEGVIVPLSEFEDIAELVCG